MGQMIPGCSCQKAADHGTGTGCEKNGAEAVNTGMKHPVCKKRPVGAHVQYEPAHNASGNKVLIDEGIIFACIRPSLISWRGCRSSIVVMTEFTSMRL